MFDFSVDRLNSNFVCRISSPPDAERELAEELLREIASIAICGRSEPALEARCKGDGRRAAG
uniref:Uncharacterized protein n=1 Tax=Candidatus Methanomethylicus mesodigestus TaxID=1867258 RepID=A0A7C3F4Q1_9CREN